jgi:uncharacterized protein (TIGR02145 family)
MESEACNYNELAECEGEECVYSCCPGPGCCGEGMFWDYELEKCQIFETCQEDLDGDGVIGVEDLMQLLSTFGTMCEEPETVELTCGDPINYHGYDYATVQIGNQCWFAENLRTELYQNGDSILAGLDNEEWNDAGYWNQGATAIYGESNCSASVPEFDACDTALALDFFGRLYNRNAVMDERQVCPSQWSVSSETDWYELEGYINATITGYSFAEYVKSQSGWYNDNGLNVAGFNARPSGWRYSNGYFQNAGLASIWWPTTNSNVSYAISLHENSSGLETWYSGTRHGYAVRCLKDTEQPN